MDAPQQEGTPALKPVFLSGQSDFVATRAATQALMEGKTMEEAEAAGFEAAGAATAQSTQAENASHEHAYYEACCNLARGVGDLPLELKREAAATLRMPMVDFNTWKERLGY